MIYEELIRSYRESKQMSASIYSSFNCSLPSEFIDFVNHKGCFPKINNPSDELEDDEEYKDYDTDEA